MNWLQRCGGKTHCYERADDGRACRSGVERAGVWEDPFREGAVNQPRGRRECGPVKNPHAGQCSQGRGQQPARGWEWARALGQLPVGVSRFLLLSARATLRCLGDATCSHGWCELLGCGTRRAGGSRLPGLPGSLADITENFTQPGLTPALSVLRPQLGTGGRLHSPLPRAGSSRSATRMIAVTCINSLLSSASGREYPRLCASKERGGT